MKVRSAEEGDLQQVKKIASTAFQLHRYWTDRGLDRRNVEGYYEAEVDNFFKELSGNRDRFNMYVVEDEGQVLGYIVLKIDEYLSRAFNQRWGTIASFALRSDSRGRGIGSVLLSKALEWFREKGAERVDVSTDAENVAAIQCYEKHGFRTVYAGVTLTKVLAERAKT
ncbi:MAG: GNAT family N-acetyltransferase [Candidatus Brockarchaeota archaeon]|nr:GNAT family N-acetyltransferase [Candidatus Brockarchaeota archaeon]